MTILDLNSRITFLTGLGTSEYLPADRLISVNTNYDKLHSIILDSQDEWDFDDSNYADLPIATTDLVASTGKYGLPATIYRMNKVEINYGAGMVKANPLDLNETLLSDSELLERITVSNPKYRVFNGTIQMYPTPTADVTGGLQLYFDREVNLFTSAEVTTGTKEPGLDRLWHDYIAIGASFDGAVKFTLNNTATLKTMLDEMESRIRKYYGQRTTDRKFRLTGYIEDYE